MQTLSGVLLDGRFSGWSWVTRTEALEVGLKPWRMWWADRCCAISSINFICCWWGSHTTDAYFSIGHTRPLLLVCSNLSGQQMGSGGWTSGSCIQKSKSPNSLAFAAANWICFTIVKPLKVFCQLYPEVLCAGDSLKGLVVEGVASGDPVPFLGHSQLVTSLYIKGHLPPPFPGLQCSEVTLCSWVEWWGSWWLSREWCCRQRGVLWTWFHHRGRWYLSRWGMALGWLKVKFQMDFISKKMNDFHNCVAFAFRVCTECVQLACLKPVIFIHPQTSWHPWCPLSLNRLAEGSGHMTSTHVC